jgi:hypothetical protein
MTLYYVVGFIYLDFLFVRILNKLYTGQKLNKLVAISKKRTPNRTITQFSEIDSVKYKMVMSIANPKRIILSIVPTFLFIAIILCFLVNYLIDLAILELQFIEL